MLAGQQQSGGAPFDGVFNNNYGFPDGSLGSPPIMQPGLTMAAQQHAESMQAGGRVRKGTEQIGILSEGLDHINHQMLLESNGAKQFGKPVSNLSASLGSQDTPLSVSPTVSLANAFGGQNGLFGKAAGVGLGSFAGGMQQQQVGQQTVSANGHGHSNGHSQHNGNGGGNQQGQQPHSNVYVKNLAEDVDELMLKATFERFGEVESCCVIRDVSTNASRGFGFVKFRKVTQAEEAIQAMHGKILHGRALEVKFANADSSISTSAPVGNVSDNIYVKGLPPTWSEVDLRTYFSAFGAISECRLLHASGTTTAGALIRFGSEEQAAGAVTGANGRIPMGSGVPLVVRFADSHGKARRGTKGQQNQQNQHGRTPGAPMAVPGGRGGSLHGSEDGSHHGANFFLSASPSTSPLHSLLLNGSVHGGSIHGGSIHGGSVHGGSVHGGSVHGGSVHGGSVHGGSVHGGSLHGGSLHGGGAAAAQMNASGMPHDLMPAGFVGYSASGIPDAQQLTAPPHSIDGGDGRLPTQSAMSAMFNANLAAASAAAAAAAAASVSASGAGALYAAADGAAAAARADVNAAAAAAALASDLSVVDLTAAAAAVALTPAEDDGTSLCLRNLPGEADDLLLYRTFAPYGAILSVRVARNEHTGKCQGAAFITFRRKDDAVIAMQACSGAVVGDRVLQVSLQPPRAALRSD